MSDYKPFNPYELFTKVSTQFEKQLNELFQMGINNREILPFAKVFTDSTALFQEKINKYQEIFGAQLNLPTKIDVANIAKLSIQAEEKIDSLEEQIWKLQDSLNSSNKEIEGIAELIKKTKKPTTETTKTKAEIDETKELRRELKELRKELSDIKSIKGEISTFLEMMAENQNKADEQKRERAEMITKK
jgi:uncharacterized coiled-coil DUF342 family protein